MAKIKDNQITIEDEQGNEHLVDVLFTYDNEHRGKSYVFFVNPDNDEEVMVMSYNEQGELFEVDDEEFQEAEEVLSAFEEEGNNNEN